MTPTKTEGGNQYVCATCDYLKMDRSKKLILQMRSPKKVLTDQEPDFKNQVDRWNPTDLTAAASCRILKEILLLTLQERENRNSDTDR